jgi:hypothetical protein
MFSLCSGYNLGMAELGEFCLISYHLMLHSDLFTCRLKGQVRREACDVPFFFISMFSLGSGYNLGMAELGEFCFVSYHLMFHSNLFTGRLTDPVRREAWDVPFFFIFMFSLCSGYNLGMAELLHFLSSYALF